MKMKMKTMIHWMKTIWMTMSLTVAIFRHLIPKHLIPKHLIPKHLIPKLLLGGGNRNQQHQMRKNMQEASDGKMWGPVVWKTTTSIWNSNDSVYKKEQ